MLEKIYKERIELLEFRIKKEKKLRDDANKRYKKEIRILSSLLNTYKDGKVNPRFEKFLTEKGI